MILWLILALMTAAAIFAVIWPLARNNRAVRSGSEIAVYRDQLDEIERDLAAGLIGQTEAEAARVEISRRLLAAADAAQTTTASSTPAGAAWRRRAVVVVSLFLLPVGAGSLYLRLGAPELALSALAAEQNVSPGQQPSVEILVARAESHLQRNPTDGHGWEVLAPVYLQLGRYADSVQAWRNTLQFLGENADRDANLGEALVNEANGIVTADANAAFARALELDSTTISARFYLAIAAEQDGKRDEAAKTLRELLAEAPAGAHWIDEARTALARVEGKAPPTPRSPTPAQPAAAATQIPQQQAAMIGRMVESLAARLKKDDSDLDGWVRLVRSYKVLGQPDKANAAAAEARRAFAGDADKMRQLDASLNALESGNVAAAATTTGDVKSTIEDAPSNHQQGEAMQSMVERLAGRLKSAPDPQGWLMLTRSYLVLGEKDKATAAIKDGRRTLADEPSKLAQFNNALKQFNINE
jgi:cytochrome c-type biogenesis protein CcmH